MRVSFKDYLILLVTYLKPQWPTVLLMAVLLLSGIGAELGYPQVMRIFIDTVSLGSTYGTLLFIALIFAGLVLYHMVAAAAGVYLSTKVAWTATNLLRRDLAAHCLSLDMSYHKAHTPGEMIERIDGDVDKLANFFSQFMIMLLGMSLFVLGVLILFFTITWYVGVAMTIFILIALVALLYLRRHALPVWQQDRQMSAIFFGFLSERLGGTEDIRANGTTMYILRRFLLLRRAWFPIYVRSSRIFRLIFTAATCLFAGGSLLALALGTYLWSIHVVSVGTVFLMFSYTQMLQYPIQQIQAQLQDLQQAGACITRVEELLQTASKLQDGPGCSLPRGALAVDFQQVIFGYEPAEPVLHNLTLHVQPGKVLGILGRTGSGKTTIAHLLFRLYDPQAGQICLGGVPIRRAKLHDLRKHVGMVTQDVQLFHASVRDNLTFFDRSIPDARILAALEDVGLAPWYRSLTLGLDTMLGSDGEGLSAGEAQLLAFTRVFLREPGLVILDEASSRLDPATERLIERAITKLLAQRSAIIIAHRLTTIQRADDILILEDGCILEYGSRTVLASDPDSRFSQLLQTGLEEVLA